MLQISMNKNIFGVITMLLAMQNAWTLHEHKHFLECYQFLALFNKLVAYTHFFYSLKWDNPWHQPMSRRWCDAVDYSSVLFLSIMHITLFLGFEWFEKLNFYNIFSCTIVLMVNPWSTANNILQKHRSVLRGGSNAFRLTPYTSLFYWWCQLLLHY